MNGTLGTRIVAHSVVGKLMTLPRFVMHVIRFVTSVSERRHWYWLQGSEACRENGLCGKDPAVTMESSLPWIESQTRKAPDLLAMAYVHENCASTAPQKCRHPAARGHGCSGSNPYFLAFLSVFMLRMNTSYGALEFAEPGGGQPLEPPELPCKPCYTMYSWHGLT